VKTQRASRRDPEGRAYRGSQMQMQLYVSRREPELSRAVLNALRNAGAKFDGIRWVAPLESNRFSEPCDGRFLAAVEQTDLRSKLAAFWPKGGPRWDALGILEPGGAVLLVEAKNYPREMLGGGCKATKPARDVIEKTIRESRDWFKASSSANWLGPLYQYANRLSHVRFFRDFGRDAWLANVCFLDDEQHGSTSQEVWDTELPRLKRELGFAEKIPHVVDVFLPARDRKELTDA
jgi:hypothetical protein